MVTTSKILGTLIPAAATPTTLYQAPAGLQTTLNVFACNQDLVNPTTISIALVPVGHSLNNSHYIVFNAPVQQAFTVQFTGIALNTGDSVVVESASGNCSFVATGMETTNGN